MATIGPSDLVARFGGHPAATVGIDPAAGGESDLEGWLTLCVLLSGARRASEEEAHSGYLGLAERGLASPRAVAERGPLAAAVALAAAGYAHAEAAAPVLARIGASLDASGAEPLLALLRNAEGIADLASRIGALAPGLGRATVERYLRPLRERSASAADLPLAAGARTAALCIGLLHEGEDEDGAPGVLRARIGDELGAPPLVDVEAALERLGARWCGRKRPEACPLGDACPRGAGA